MSDMFSPPVESPVELDVYSMACAIYAEDREGRILLIKRAEGSALAGQFFLPGGLVDPGELPFTAAARELEEETGLRAAGPMEMIGCYPMFLYGRDFMQLTFRCRVDGDVELSHEHTDFMWVDATLMQQTLSPEGIEQMAAGNDRFELLLGHIAEDLARYIAGR